MSLCRIQQLRQHSTFDYKASCQERLFQGRRRFVLRNHTQIFCLRTRKKAHASSICTCRHALACPCRDERYVMSLPDLVLHTFSQKRKLVFLCFLRVIHQKHETPAPAVQIGSGALKQMAETEAIRQASSKPSDNAASPSTASLRRPVPEIFIACHPSSSAIRARSPRSVVLPEPRGPTRRMRRPGAPGPSQIPSRKSSLTDALSLWKAVRRASVASSGTGPVFTMAHPSFGSRCPKPAEFSRHGRKSPAAQSLQGMERVKQDQPGKPAGITPMPAPFSARWTRKNGICRSVHSRKGSARPQTGSALSHIPICRRQAFMCAISPKASFPPAVSVARYRQIAWPQASPSSA